MEQKYFYCYNQRLAAWLMLHNMRLLDTIKKKRLIFVFNQDEKIDVLLKSYNKIVYQED